MTPLEDVVKIKIFECYYRPHLPAGTAMDGISCSNEDITQKRDDGPVDSAAQPHDHQIESPFLFGAQSKEPLTPSPARSRHDDGGDQQMIKSRPEKVPSANASIQLEMREMEMSHAKLRQADGRDTDSPVGAKTEQRLDGECIWDFTAEEANTDGKKPETKKGNNADHSHDGDASPRRIPQESSELVARSGHLPIITLSSATASVCADWPIKSKDQQESRTPTEEMYDLPSTVCSPPGAYRRSALVGHHINYDGKKHANEATATSNSSVKEQDRVPAEYAATAALNSENMDGVGREHVPSIPVEANEEEDRNSPTMLQGRQKAAVAVEEDDIPKLGERQPQIKEEEAPSAYLSSSSQFSARPGANSGRSSVPALPPNRSARKVTSESKEEDERVSSSSMVQDEFAAVDRSVSQEAGPTALDENPPWPMDIHRSFVAAIFEIGLKQCSPSVIMDAMKTLPSNITREKTKSHLQKFRKIPERSQEEFMCEYDEFMRLVQEASSKANGSDDTAKEEVETSQEKTGDTAIQLGPTNRQSQDAAASLEIVTDKADPQKLVGGKAAAYAAYAIANGCETPEDTNQIPYEATREDFPILTEQEEETELGKSLTQVKGALQFVADFALKTRHGIPMKFDKRKPPFLNDEDIGTVVPRYPLSGNFGIRKQGSEQLHGSNRNFPTPQGYPSVRSPGVHSSYPIPKAEYDQTYSSGPPGPPDSYGAMPFAPGHSPRMGGICNRDSMGAAVLPFPPPYSSPSHPAAYPFPMVQHPLLHHSHFHGPAAAPPPHAGQPHHFPIPNGYPTATHYQQPPYPAPLAHPYQTYPGGSPSYLRHGQYPHDQYKQAISVPPVAIAHSEVSSDPPGQELHRQHLLTGGQTSRRKRRHRDYKRTSPRRGERDSPLHSRSIFDVLESPTILSTRKWSNSLTGSPSRHRSSDHEPRSKRVRCPSETTKTLSQYVTSSPIHRSSQQHGESRKRNRSPPGSDESRARSSSRRSQPNSRASNNKDDPGLLSSSFSFDMEDLGLYPNSGTRSSDANDSPVSLVLKDIGLDPLQDSKMHKHNQQCPSGSYDDEHLSEHPHYAISQSIDSHHSGNGSVYPENTSGPAVDRVALHFGKEVASSTSLDEE